MDAGASHCTHLGNGAHAVLPRHPNYIWEQLATDGLTAGIIADGHHLPPAVVKSFVRAKGLERTVLVSDAIAAAGCPRGATLAPGDRRSRSPRPGESRWRTPPTWPGPGYACTRG